MSRLLTFSVRKVLRTDCSEGAAEVNIRCYLHMSDYAPQGWYDRAERTAPLRMSFSY